jgi:uncharacterized protein YecE (DUF72 family)
LAFNNAMEQIYIGTAGWSLAKELRQNLEIRPSVLELYGQIFNSVEINSSFYRDHKASTYRRWGEAVPNEFRFCVKVSRRFTHEQQLQVKADELFENLSSVLFLGSKLASLLVQLPPSLNFHAENASHFFSLLRRLYAGPIAFEPRNISWTSEEAVNLIKKYSLARVWADPEPFADANKNLIGSGDFVYYRLHGFPKIYYSSYTEEALRAYAEKFKLDLQAQKKVWCIFDNTALGHAAHNAIHLKRLIASPSVMSEPVL